MAKQLAGYPTKTLTTLTSQHQVVHVTFPSTPDTDLDIKHTLKVSDPEHVDYQVLKVDKACAVYHDATVSRKPWIKNLIYLRCNVASAEADLLLSVRDPAIYTLF